MRKPVFGKIIPPVETNVESHRRNLNIADGPLRLRGTLLLSCWGVRPVLVQMAFARPNRNPDWAKELDDPEWIEMTMSALKDTP
jgi:hypothetical protein